VTNFFTQSRHTNDARSFLSKRPEDKEAAEDTDDEELTDDEFVGVTEEEDVAEELTEDSDDEEDEELSSLAPGRSLAMSFMYDTRLTMSASFPESYVSLRLAYGPKFSLQDGISKSVGR